MKFFFAAKLGLFKKNTDSKSKLTQNKQDEFLLIKNERGKENKTIQNV